MITMHAGKVLRPLKIEKKIVTGLLTVKALIKFALIFQKVLTKPNFILSF